MKAFVVGGYVRDQLVGRPVADRDWVVVGATPAEMIAAGFTPVGRDFPVFLHPQTHEEYALARTERKTAPGYTGFVFHASPDVTLEQDLGRRDLTINAMAFDADGSVIDPFGGRADLAARCLRHVGPAFSEDPVRILRLARFAARFPDFTVAPATAELMRAMVRDGEADALVAERVLQELVRGLAEDKPSRMLEVLDDCGLLACLYPELEDVDAAKGILDRAAVDRELPSAARFALLCRACPTSRALTDVLAKLHPTTEQADLARLLFDLGARLAAAQAPGEFLDVIERADGLRRPARFATLLQAWSYAESPATNDRAGAGRAEQIARWRQALAAARGVDAGAIAGPLRGDVAQIAPALTDARTAAIQAAFRA